MGWLCLAWYRDWFLHRNHNCFSERLSKRITGNRRHFQLMPKPDLCIVHCIFYSWIGFGFSIGDDLFNSIGSVSELRYIQTRRK